MEEIKIAFIGCGAMGGALARAVKGASTFTADVVVTAAHYENALSFASSASCRAEKRNIDAVKDADIVFIAVKPQYVKQVIEEVWGGMKKGTILVSMAAGVEINELTQYAVLGNYYVSDIDIARIMPNVGASVRQSMTALCCLDTMKSDKKELLIEVLNSAGIVREVPESLMPIVTAVSGSGPSYVFIFIEALSDAAVRGGMKRNDAYAFAIQTVLGSATLAMNSKKGCAELKDDVCSPSGTTIEGVAALEANGFRHAVMEAVNAAYKKCMTSTVKDSMAKLK